MCHFRKRGANFFRSFESFEFLRLFRGESVKDELCIEFLQWALPKLGYRWEGFKKVRNQVCKRIAGRLENLQLRGLSQYREFLNTHPEEWEELDSLCYVSISRFFRDYGVFNFLGNEIFPSLAERADESNEDYIRCWSVGSCSGEEPYTLSLLWKIQIAPVVDVMLAMKIVATEHKGLLIERALKARYPESSVKDVPAEILHTAFEQRDGEYLLKRRFRLGVTFLRQDIRESEPLGEFHLILCRNLVFTYFQEELQRSILSRLIHKLRPGGFLVIGAHETLPEEHSDLTAYAGNHGIYQRDTE